MIEKISDFLFSYKNKMMEAENIEHECSTKIKEFAKKLRKNDNYIDFEENFLTILGYSYRLENISQRLFFTFQEAVYAIDLDKLMKNNDSLKLNSIVYILVLDVILDEYNSNDVDEKLKEKALTVYKKIEEKKSKENKKYHMYQY